MARVANIYRIFVASPSGLEEERQSISDAIEELNRTWVRTINARLEFVGWETDTYPSAGQDAQDTINRQIQDDYEIFVGIIGSRIGSATRRHVSGTVEEFERAFARYKSSESPQIMIYFKNEDVRSNSIDIEQLIKVREFQENIRERGIYYFEFSKAEDFSQLVRSHLSTAVQALITHAQQSNVPNLRTEEAGNPKEIIDCEEEDVGLLDAIDAVEENFENITEQIKILTSATSDLTQSMNEKTEELRQQVSGDRRAAQRIINSIALAMDRFSTITFATLPAYRDAFIQGTKSYSDVLELSVDFPNARETDESRQLATSQVIALSITIQSAIESAALFRDSIATLPRIAKNMNLSRREAVKALDAIIQEFESNYNVLIALTSPSQGKAQ